ncbi:kinetochore protein SPC24 homolog isoform X1 [Syzygium oleosum]|uniref:kinetochore protein SPC24 homolog isoform X1 n=1 Tax=Syzygium oleosum TaxID=219896 RepID=UPI0024BBB1CC|nr:kinetochore protein SPC24 homolog isoform X1 [Syzygium oleosum]
MGDLSRNIDLQKLVSYSDDLAQVLRDDNGAANLALCLRHSGALRSSCDADLAGLRSSLLAEYGEKIDACKKKTEAVRSEVAGDVDIDQLEKELQEELEKEQLLMEDLRIVTNEINELDLSRISIEERKQALKKLEQHERREQMSLSMYASVTNIIPNLGDCSKISGYIVDREKRVVDRFEFDSTEMTAFDTCTNIWRMISNS